MNEHEIEDFPGIGEAIRCLRASAGLSQYKLAEMVGCTNSSISKYEAGTQIPSIEMMEKIAKAIDLPSEQLVLFWLKHRFPSLDKSELGAILERLARQVSDFRRKNGT